MPENLRKTPRPSSDLIDRNLKRAYEEALEEEIPDRFKDLLARLKQAEGGRDAGGSQ